MANFTSLEKDSTLVEVTDNAECTKESPIVRRMSSFFVQDQEGSECTEPTLPSEVVERQIDEYKRQQRAQALETEEFQKNNNLHFKLHVGKVVFVGGGGGSGVGGGPEINDVNIEDKMAYAMDDILTNRIDIEKITKEYISADETRWQKVRRQLLRKKKFSIPIIIILLALIGGLSFTVYFFVTQNTTTPEQQQSHKLVKREEWQSASEDSLPLAGKFKIIAPVNRIILLETQTDMCATEAECWSFMLERQQSAYPEYDDIRENFIIAQDGTVFEGRGFEREGETTCEDDAITCYDSKAISVAYVTSNATSGSRRIDEQQLSALCQLVRNNTEAEQQQGTISESFNVFHHDNLISSVSLAPNDYSCVQSRLFIAPEIVKPTIDSENIDDGLVRRFSTHVRVTNNTDACSSKENCLEAISKLNQTSANFAIGEDAIFAVNHFDLAVSESLYDTLVFLFVGNYATNLRSLITEVFSGFLGYAVALGKLSENYTICAADGVASQLRNEIENVFSEKFLCNS